MGYLLSIGPGSNPGVSLHQGIRATNPEGGSSEWSSVLPELWRHTKARAGVLADVEIGPLLGAGGYGKVYKGARPCPLVKR